MEDRRQHANMWERTLTNRILQDRLRRKARLRTWTAIQIGGFCIGILVGLLLK